MFKRIQGDLKKIWSIDSPKDRWKEANKFILNELSPNFEIYSQDKYTYSYIRANGGYGNECQLLTFPINYAASVAVGLTFMEEW